MFCLIFLAVIHLKGQYIISMNPDHQVYTEELVLKYDESDFEFSEALIFGILSRYSPLSDITQVGRISIFQSDCFHNFNAVGKQQNINFIYYDCIDQENKLITKNVKFIDDSHQEHHYQVIIPSDQYENVWYYFLIRQWPVLKKLQILIAQNNLPILQEELTITYPLYDQELTLSFGGGVTAYFQSSPLQQSYFPGKIYAQPSGFFENKDPEIDEIKPNLSSYKCECTINDDLQIIDSKYLQMREKIIFTSASSNCNYFQLIGWLKISEIISDVKDFSFHLISMTKSTQNNLFKNQNLSPLNLYYFIQDSGNKIVYTTYSYSFPSINIDFSSDPYLIQKEFEIHQSLYQWHYISVSLIDTQFIISIEFPDGINSLKYEQITEVTQFKIVTFEIQIGNIQDSKLNYLNYMVNSFKFSNCDTVKFTQACHYSCSLCDGPTENDCLECQLNSNRIYLSELKKCVCPYDSIDVEICQTYTDYNFILSQENDQINQCQYGQFEYNNECLTWQYYKYYISPETVNDQQINCIECLINPKTWKDMLYCQSSIISQNDQSYQDSIDNQYFYIIDGQDVKFCQTCKEICQGDDCYEKEFQQTIFSKSKICSNRSAATQSDIIPKIETCYECKILGCLVCGWSQTGLYCIICTPQTIPSNRICKLSYDTVYALNACFKNCSLCKKYICYTCFQPYYLNQDRSQCKICPIKHCKYCFEYQKNDLTKTTLYKDFESFLFDEYTQIGCSLCEDGYNFDFQSGECIYGQAQIENCLRSYRNLEGLEVCVLSAIDDFNVAPEIIDCQQHLYNCLQCILTPDQSVKCVLCENGYTASNSGICKVCTLEVYTPSCIEGDHLYRDYWVESIQSFMMQFLPNNYIYPKIEQYSTVQEFAISCPDNYKKYQDDECEKYCDTSCLTCSPILAKSYRFQCTKCPLNYYGLQIKSLKEGNCLSCSNLCLLCSERTQEEIYKINPNFVTTYENIVYTYKCLRSINPSLTYIDPNSQIVSYCFDSKCSRSLSKQITRFDDPYTIWNSIDFNYCNAMGISIFNFIYYIEESQNFNEDNFFGINFKQKIFSLQSSYFQLIGQFGYLLYKNFHFNYFDRLEISNLKLKLKGNKILNVSNPENSVDIFIKNCVFEGLDQYGTTDFRILLNLYKDLFIYNVQFINFNLKDSTLFDYNSNYDEEFIKINVISFINCTFQNGAIFSFNNYHQSISFSQINITNTTFINSTFVYFKYQESSEGKVLIDHFTILKSTFLNSSLIINLGSFQTIISQFNLMNNYFINTLLVEANQNSIMDDINIYNNTLQESIFFRAFKQSNMESQTIHTFTNFNISFIYLTNSILIYIVQDNQQSKILSVIMQNFIHVNLIKIGEYKQSAYLYNINSYQIQILNHTFFICKSLLLFRIYQTKSISLNQIIYSANSQIIRIQPSFECYQDQYYTSTLLYVLGFSDIEVSNVQIANQFSIDSSLIHIISDLLFQVEKKEKVNFNNITFFGNILLKRNLAIFFSSIVIYSDNIQKIVFENLKFEQNFFHQLIDDPTQTTAGLIYINSLLSDIKIENIKCLSNGITNSSSTIISLSSQSLILNQFQIIDSNQMVSSIWLKYYQIDESNQTEIVKIQMIQKVYSILSKGGVGQIYSSNILISNGYFYNIISQSSSIFYITTQGDGIIQFTNHTIIRASILPQQTLTADGCITIYSINSLLKIQINNIYFENIYNRLGSAIFTVYPSLKQNFINFTNIQINNCFSLINSFMAIEFFQESAQMNNLILNQIIANFTIEGWKEYLQYISYPQTTELARIKQNNGFINLKACSLITNDIQISGLMISPILLLNNILKLKLKNFRSQNIQVMYPLRLFQFIFSLNAGHFMFLDQIYFINTEKKEIVSNTTKEPSEQAQIINFKILNCNIQWLFNSQTTDNQNQSINNFIQFLNQDTDQIGSLIFMQGLTQLSKVQTTKIILINNNCDFCYDGQISIIQKTQAFIRIQDMNCFNNYAIQFGCLVLQSDQNSQNKIIVSNSEFLQNNGSSGIGIYSKNVNLKIIDGNFIYNEAKEKAGAIYLEYFENTFLIKNSIIQNNKAEIGGGLYLGGINHITDQNFINTVLLSNQATLISNNLVEAPDHLTLKLNEQDMQSIYQENDIQVLKLQPYTILDQDKLIITDKLYFPSNQQLYTYQRFNTKTLSFQNYITQLALYLKNSLNEEILGNEQDFCEFSERQIDLQQSLQNLTQSDDSVTFDSQMNSFNIGNLQVNFDPYQSEAIILQLLFQCYSASGNKYVKYEINAKTFMCQLGEFYTNGSCQLCEPTYGFYSVNYNVTRCSVFDSSKFLNITSNQIRLKEGYWRPNYQSDTIQDCFKNTQACKGGWNVNYHSCQQGHIGGLCEECDIYNVRGDGYYAKTDNSECIICKDGFSQYIPFIFLTIWSFISILITLNSIWNTNKTFARLKAITKLYEIVFNLNQDFHSILLKMLLNYLWIYSIMLTFNIHFDFSFETVNKVSTPSASIASNLDCQLRKIDLADLIYIRIITTFLFINFQVITVSLGYKILSKIMKFSYDNSIIINAGMHLYISNQASLIKSLGSLTAVRTISEIYYIQGNVNLLFYESNHLKWNYIFVIPALAIFGGLIPFVLFVIFIQNKTKFNNAHFRRYLGYLYNEYSKENKFWESIKIIQKTLIIIFLTSFETNTYIQATLISLTMLIYQIMAQKRKPYVIKRLNLLDVESGQIILIANFLAILKYVSEQNNQYTLSIILSIIIILLLIRLFYSFVYEISIFYHKKYFQTLLILLKNIFTVSVIFNKISLYFMKKLKEHQKKSQRLQFNFSKLRSSTLLSQQRRYNNFSSPTLNQVSLTFLQKNTQENKDQFRIEKNWGNNQRITKNAQQDALGQ